MTEKRYFQVDFDEVYYIVDSDDLPEGKSRYAEDVIEYSLNGEEVVDLLNNYEFKLEKIRKALIILIDTKYPTLNHVMEAMLKIREEVTMNGVSDEL